MQKFHRRDAERAEKRYLILPLRGRQNQNISVSGRFAAGSRLLNFLPRTANLIFWVRVGVVSNYFFLRWAGLKFLPSIRKGRNPNNVRFKKFEFDGIIKGITSPNCQY